MSDENKRPYPLNKLDPYFLAYNKIDENSEYDVLYLEPEELLSTRRIDVVVKYYYIKAKETGKNYKLARKVYEKHLEAFSDGTFTEHGNKDKDSLEKYIESFDNLIADFKKRGFAEEESLLPIGKNREILDGSHRLACSLYFGQKLKLVQFPHLSVNYGFSFFKKRLLSDCYLDFIAKEYVRLKPDVRALLVWPRIGRNKNIKYIEKVLRAEKWNVIYKKKSKLDQDGLWNLLFCCYGDRPWAGYKGNNFKGISIKRDQCYDEAGYLMVYILECSEIEKLDQLKRDLREHFGVEKGSMHSTDTQEETLEILDFILNENYDSLLYEYVLNNIDSGDNYLKYLRRKIRYLYRKYLNKLKEILGKPV